MNKEWHSKHNMPRNPTAEQRLKWHIEHAKNCGCRPMPKSLLAKAKNLLNKERLGYDSYNSKA